MRERIYDFCWMQYVIVCVCFLFEGDIDIGRGFGGGVKATDKTERENRKREIGEGSLQLWQLLCDLWGVA